MTSFITLRIEGFSPGQADVVELFIGRNWEIQMWFKERHHRVSGFLSIYNSGRQLFTDKDVPPGSFLERLFHFPYKAGHCGKELGGLKIHHRGHFGGMTGFTRLGRTRHARVIVEWLGVYHEFIIPPYCMLHLVTSGKRLHSIVCYRPMSMRALLPSEERLMELAFA